MSALTLGLTENRILLLNLLLFAVGMALDAGPAILILGSILGPIFVGQLGLDPLNFAIITCVNATEGLVTHPMGLPLFVTSSVLRSPANRFRTSCARCSRSC